MFKETKTPQKNFIYNAEISTLQNDLIYEQSDCDPDY